MKGELTKDQAMEILTRGTKVGGLELTQEAAVDFLSRLDERKAQVEFETPVEIVSLEKISQEPTDILNQSDAQEIAEIATKTEHLRTLPPPTSKEELVDRIISEAKLSISDPILIERFKVIADARLRDLRDAVGTRGLLESSTEQGGLALVGRALVDALEAIERGVDTYQTVFADRLKEEQHSAREVQVQEQEARNHLGQTEESLMAKRYVQMTGEAPTELVSPVAYSCAYECRSVSEERKMVASKDRSAKCDV